MEKKISKKLLSIFFVVALISIVTATQVNASETYSFQLAWGTEGSGNGQFEYPDAIAVDASGNVYVTDGYHIQKFDSSGNYITQLETYSSANGPFLKSVKVAVDASGNVYSADGYHIQKFDSNGKHITQWGTEGSGNGQFKMLTEIAVDTLGNVYVTDMGNYRIQKFDSSGNYITQWGTKGSGNGQFKGYIGIAVDTLGNVYVTDNENYRIQKFDSSGSYITQWGTEGSGNGQFKMLSGIAVDTSGNVYVTDMDNSNIQKFDSSGNYINQWGTSGTGNGQFEQVSGIAVDAWGNIYVTDRCNNRIQKFSNTSITTIAPVTQKIAINKGNSLDLTKYLNLNGTNVTWKSSNTNVATVNNGVVTAIGTGNATISVAGQDGTQYGIFTINVNNNNVNKGDLNTIRLGGQDRYETSAVISQAGWKNGSAYAVLANGDNYPDALGAAPLAKKYNSPILLTNTNSMPQSIYNEIKRLNVNHIFICGGTGVVSKAVESQLNSMGITTERLGGKDRYETSVLIAKKLGVVSGEVMTTNGYEWSDALSASSIAAKKGIPIILTDKDKLPDPTRLFLNSSHFNKTYILGDTDLVSDTVANEFPNSERIVGNTEYERNINIIKRFQNDIDFSNICIASGKNFPDALSGSALATTVSSAIVLVDNSDLQSITTQYASQNLMKVNNIYVFGLQGSVNDDIIKKLFSK